MDPISAIEKLLTKPGATETSIGKLAGVSQSTINRIRHGKRDPRLAVARRLVELAAKVRR